MDNLILFQWFLRLFKPEWVLAYLYPGLGFVKGIPTLLLYFTILYMILYEYKKLVLDRPYFIFWLSILLSTVFAHNTGLGRQALSGTFDSLIFFIVTVSIMRNSHDTDRLLSLYIASFIFYGVIGTQNHGLVPFHLYLKNEDAFGPFMSIGVPLSFYLAFKNDKTKYRYLVVCLLSTTGVIASFARGAFVSLCVVVLFMWYKSPRKLLATITIGLLCVFVVITPNILFKDNTYWNEMGTIYESVAEGKYISGTQEVEEGRRFYIRKAWEMFISNPLFGVGPFNYGFVLPRITTSGEADEKGVRAEHLYHRVPHNIYAQILAELGIFGMIAFLAIGYSFWKKNRKIQMAFRKENGDTRGREGNDISSDLRKYYYYAMAFQGAMVAYLANGFFYDILFYHWLPDLLIMNYLVYSQFQKKVSEGRIATQRSAKKMPPFSRISNYMGGR